MKRFSMLTIFVLGCCLIIAPKTKAETPYLEFSAGSELRANLNYAFMQQNTTTDSVKQKLYNHPDYILPKKPLFFSALIPGAGQLYCGSYLKSALFVGIEVGAWLMYANYHNQGKDKEKEYEAFADEYWDQDKWQAWFNNLSVEEKKVFSHSLPETKTQQYYEMIGKYNQFLVGWEGVDPNLTSKEIHEEQYNSPLREKYMDIRYDSNKMLKRANTGAYIAMFNHVLSAIDAAWTAKRHNSRLIQTSLRLENKYFNYEDHTMLTLKVNW